MTGRRAPLADRLAAKLASAPSGCMEFTGHLNASGYGVIIRSGPSRRTALAHRVVWELAHGPIPAGAVICHRCDNPSCCNVDHLFIGTPRINAEDRVAKGRGACGERVHFARLTDEEVLEIRRLRAEGWLFRELAERFDVSTPTISAILTGRTWKHLLLADEAAS